MEVVAPSKVCFPLIYISLEVMLNLRIDGIGSCSEDHLLLFPFDLYMYVCMYVCVYVFRHQKMHNRIKVLLKFIIVKKEKVFING